MAELQSRMKGGLLAAGKLSLEDRWIYLLTLYPVISAIPYFVVTDQYASWSRLAFVLSCALLAAALLYLLLSSGTGRVRHVMERCSDHWIWIVAALCAVLMFYLAYEVRIRNGFGGVRDVATLEQVFWAGSQGQWFFSSANHGSYLSGHFALFLAVLTLIYRIVPNLAGIFAVQSLLLSLAAIPLYQLLKDTAGRIPAFLIGLAYLINPVVLSQHVTLYDSHFAGFFWLGAAYGFWRKHFWLFAIFSLLAASVQEDIAFSLLIFALLAWLQNRPRNWKLFSLAFPVAWFTLAMLVIQANSRMTGIALGGNFSDLGQTPREIAFAVIGHPGILLAKLTDNAPVKILQVYELLSPVLFLIPFATPMVLAAIPDWLVLSLSSTVNGRMSAVGSYSLAWYYNYFIMVVLFTAVAYSMNWLYRRIPAGSARHKIMTVISVLILCSNLAMLPLGLAPEMFKSDSGQRQATIGRIKALVPADACVAVPYDIMQPFAQRYQLYELNSDAILHTCRYFVVSPDLAPGYRPLVQTLEHGEEYQKLLAEDQFELFVRRCGVRCTP